VKTVVIAQARIGSSRLPGKILKPLAGRPVLAHVLARAGMAKRVDSVCVATTVKAEDDPVAEIAQGLGVAVFRGSETDVLGRYVGAAEMTAADIVVRITCDCPLIDPAVIDQTVGLRAGRNADYACNGLELDWPHGLDCEVFTRAMLDAAASATDDAYDREHVTPWIRTRGARLKSHLPGPGRPAADQRWVVDYPEDYEFLSRLFALSPGGQAPLAWQDICGVVQANPSLSSINQHLRRTSLPK
jgi:spore coat polysaccharide biosynthesis protein SpsF